MNRWVLKVGSSFPPTQLWAFDRELISITQSVAGVLLNNNNNSYVVIIFLLLLFLESDIAWEK